MNGNIIYFGSPDFSAQILESLINLKYNVVAVVTTPDTPIGRKQILTPSPVAMTASKYDLPIFKPEKLDSNNLSHLKLLKPDIFLVVSYGKIFPNSYLQTPKIGTFNIHFSLLPKYRGALCISEAIKNQDTETGVTLMLMDEKLDHGPIILQEKVSIDLNDNIETLTTKLTQAAIHLLANQLPLLTTSKISIQDESQATYTPPKNSRTRDSAFIPWSDIKSAMSNKQSALKLHALIRSLNPDPGVWTTIPTSSLRGGTPTRQSISIKIIKTSLEKNLNLNTYALILELVQLPGKTPISWQNFLSGHHLI